MDISNTKLEKKNQGLLPTILTAILSVVLIILLIILFVYGNLDGVSKEELEKDYIKKTKVTFNDLPFSIQQSYVLKSIYDADLENAKKVAFEENNETIKTPEQNATQTVISESPESKEESTTLQNEEKIVKKDDGVLTHINFDESKINRDRFEYYKCYKMGIGEYNLTNECKKELKAFVLRNKDKPLFEVIGVTDTYDFKVIEGLEKSPKVREDFKINLDDVSRYKHIAIKGLSSLRAKETIWEMKQILGENAQIIPTSYNIESKNHSRGTIIRAYYPKK